jgi:membrane-associated phospholipid phosphatase
MTMAARSEPGGSAAIRRRPQRFLRSGCAVSALVALSLLVGPNRAWAWEDGTVEAATRTPDALGAPSRAVMQLGTRPAVVVVALALTAVLRRPRAGLAVLSAGVVAMLTTPWLKEVVSRPRPDGVRVRDVADGFGFPSGHVTMAFTLAAVAAAYLPGRWRWIAFGAAAVVGFARMHVGVHFPLDVVGGALWGLALGWTVVALPWFWPSRTTDPELPAAS